MGKFDHMKEYIGSEAIKWLETLSDAAQEAALHYPPNSVFQGADGSKLYLCGYTTDGNYLLTPVDVYHGGADAEKLAKSFFKEVTREQLDKAVNGEGVFVPRDVSLQ